jgi:hypothetical protein
MPRLVSTFWILFAAISCVAQQQPRKEEPEFPKSNEIVLVVTQAERAFQEYKQSVALELELPTSLKDPSAAKKDLQVFDETIKLISALKTNPEGFHGLGGLLLLSALDDASRNAALCSGTAYGDAMQTVMAGDDVNAARDYLHIGLSCLGVSGHLYTVSESVQELVVREAKAQQILNQQATEFAEKCSALMRNAPLKKQ